ncbi:glutathione S-transferase D7 [Anopheles arabiensis]|uniref:glutathione S-transferase D7 n=1 Tax=Anopheles arabiensis TaxID=7173 RepID=UPI001AAD34F0|nr:glutathione S-transferase D7 [Anopheles arabiensis]
MMPVLYYLPPSPPCRSVLLLAKMIGVELELKALNVMEGEQLKPDFVELNPQHCIPTLDDHGLVLWESRVILAYLVSAYGKDENLYPKDFRSRAIVDQRLHFDLGTLYQRVVDYYFPTIQLGAHLDQTKKAKLAEALGWFEAMLKQYQWSAANHFTIADIALCVTVSQIEAFQFDLHPYPRVRAWLQKCKDELQGHGYKEINETGAETLAGLFRSKLKQ